MKRDGICRPVLLCNGSRDAPRCIRSARCVFVRGVFGSADAPGCIPTFDGESAVVTIACPTGFVVGGVFGYQVAILFATDDMVVVARLPAEINIVTPCKPCYRLFVTSNHHTKGSTNCRDAPRCIRIFANGDYCMDMIRHHNVKGYFRIGIVSAKGFQSYPGKFSDGR